MHTFIIINGHHEAHHVQDLTIHVNQLRVEASFTRHRAEEAAASHAASTSRNKALQVLTFLRNSGRAGGFHVGAAWDVFERVLMSQRRVG